MSNTEEINFVRFPDRLSLQREIRFYMQYFQANKLLQSAKWLGELLTCLSGGAGDDEAYVLADVPPSNFRQKKKVEKS